MRPPRLRAWVLSGLVLAVAFAFAVAECTGGMFLVATLALGGIDDVDPRSLYAAAVLLIAGLVVISLTITLSVAIVAGDRGPSLWHVRRRHRPRSRLRTLTVVVAAFATFLALFVYSGRAFRAKCTARSHAESAGTYRWLQGLDSESRGILNPRFPSDFWTPKQLEYLQESLTKLARRAAKRT